MFGLNFYKESGLHQNSNMDELSSFLDLPQEFLNQFNSNIFSLAQGSSKYLGGPFANNNSPSRETTGNSIPKTNVQKKKNTKFNPSMSSESSIKQCPFCPYKTKVQAHVKRHIMCKHTNERPHKCTICPYSTANKSNMKMHMMIHTGERQFACPFCPYKAIRKDYMKRHIRKQHSKSDSPPPL